MVKGKKGTASWKQHSPPAPQGVQICHFYLVPLRTGQPQPRDTNPPISYLYPSRLTPRGTSRRSPLVPPCTSSYNANASPGVQVTLFRTCTPPVPIPPILRIPVLVFFSRLAPRILRQPKSNNMTTRQAGKRKPEKDIEPKGGFSS